jgi:hypothetical protein
MRLSASLVSGGGNWLSIPVNLDGSMRVYEYWSGRPRWVMFDQSTVDHPNGWTREFYFIEYSENSDEFVKSQRAGHGPSGYCIWVSRDQKVSFFDTGNLFQ